MKLTTQAIAEIQKSQRCRNRLAFELDKSHQTIQRHLEINDRNSSDSILVTTKAVQIISEETGLSKDEILTESVEA